MNPRDTDESRLPAGTTPAAELVNAIALRANLPAINAAIGTAPTGQRAERVAVVASAMRTVGATIDDISKITSGIAAMIAAPGAENRAGPSTGKAAPAMGEGGAEAVVPGLHARNALTRR